MLSGVDCRIAAGNKRGRLSMGRRAMLSGVDCYQTEGQTEDGGLRAVLRDRGQVAVIMVLVLFLVFITAVVIAETTKLFDESAKARTAADAAALAGAAEGRAAAVHMASENGGTLVSYSENVGYSENIVTVVVKVGRATQTARASARVEWATRQ